MARRFTTAQDAVGLTMAYDVVDSECTADATQKLSNQFMLRSTAVVRCLSLSLSFSGGCLGFASAACQQHLH
jgi:hypothetical protein